MSGALTGVAAIERPPWPVRRLFPLLAAVVMTAVGMAGTIWGPRYYGKTAWALPDDLWGTLIAAQRLAHLNLAGLYTLPTQLVSLPGTAVILVPAIVVIDVTGLRLGLPSAHGAYPAVWLFAGPYQVAISAVTLFAADAIAERLGATRPKRFWLAAVGATALWSVTIRWGHPEDAVAVGLLLYAVLALADSKTSRSAWLAGAAVAVQPLVLLAFPILAAVVEPRKLAGYVARAAAPAALLLAAAAAANWTATIHAVTSQPNSPAIDHPTPWISLSPHLAGGQVAAGPARIVAIVAACGCALVVARRWRAARPGGRWGHRGAGGVAVVDRGDAGAPFGVRAGDGGLLPVAAAGGGPRRGGQGLVAPPPDRVRRRGAHVLFAGPVAQPVDLVDADGRRAGPSPVLRPDPDPRTRPGAAGAARAGGAVRRRRRAMRRSPRRTAG